MGHVTTRPYAPPRNSSKYTNSASLLLRLLPSPLNSFLGKSVEEIKGIQRVNRSEQTHDALFYGVHKYRQREIGHRIDFSDRYAQIFRKSSMTLEISWESMPAMVDIAKYRTRKYEESFANIRNIRTLTSATAWSIKLLSCSLCSERGYTLDYERKIYAERTICCPQRFAAVSA
jgi:hypothetical protein